MEENLIALLELIEEFQRDYNIGFDVWACLQHKEVQAVKFDNGIDVLASVDRREK